MVLVKSIRVLSQENLICIQVCYAERLFKCSSSITLKTYCYNYWLLSQKFSE